MISYLTQQRPKPLMH